ncbi:MAG: TRAP transporter small permease subunit, partial [Pseudomonadota bacterium]
LNALCAVNNVVLLIGRHIAWMCLALMTLIILYQIVLRYMFALAPNWSEEAARFLMLWMTGLIAPSAYRWGGFVAIDTVVRLLPRAIAALLSLVLLVLALTVLVVGLRISFAEVTGFSGSFATAALWVPLDLVGGESFRVPRSWMMGSMLVGIALLLSVNVEHILRTIAKLIDPDAPVPVDKHMIAAGAE